MTLLGRYLAREILAAILFVLAAFLALFTFFDFINELEDIGRGGYRVRHALAFVADPVETRRAETDDDRGEGDGGERR